MIKINGIVVDVFIPEQYKNGNLLDVMDRNYIGFKIKTDNKIKEFILEQDKNNSRIMKNHLVTIIEQNISGKDLVEIELYDGDEHE